MSAALMLANEPRVAPQTIWVGPEEGEDAWLLVRAQHNASTLTIEVPTHTQLFAAAACTGRARWMVRIVDAWVEQRCEAFIVSSSGDSATIALHAVGAAVRVDDDLGCLPRT